ncbi:tRNA(His) guanylyltransferase Thg1 family protein [Streptomyces europaeiscabiei]|uniref:tRNA(His) guanylyltransferase Thg1 family protein n=1 Tax=Streptomyces europaeiscabiei TaxID=146819 RepID=UPI0029A7A5AE|nr:tRNA(His) guanylyltransferase Thg1 family protein [Streptomyces europaeiscabiei]MDX3549480.1 tRNA(His) guanylyltransferase Thg1 family protein [Streptomyces europaeiscabiei]
MSDSTSLGDRMKEYEAVHRVVLPRRTYCLIRLDIRAAHTYLRGAQRPFDEEFMADMDAVAEAVCAEISGTVFAYTQSDEISLLVTDFATTQTQPWFGGVVAKQVSISAALATAVLNERRPGKRVLFDSRVFTISGPVEVANYFLWRQRDAVRNSISMAAQARFPHKRLHGLNGDQMQELLFTEADINWNDYPAGCKRGRVTVRHVGEKPVEYVDKRTNQTVLTAAVRSWWETSPAPHFTTKPDGWLAETIPAMPTLKGAN